MASNPNQPAGLATEPVTAKPKKRRAKNAISQAVPIGKSAGKKFNPGDLVLFHVKHLHALHGTVVMDAGEGQYVVRGGEEAIEGHLFQFSADQLEPADAAALQEHHSTRLEWDYKD